VEEAKREPVCLKVSIDDIKAKNYNLDIKNPNTVDEAHRDPEELLSE